MFSDAGVTNNNPQIRLNQLATLRLFRPCATCNLLLEFTLLPKNPGVNPYDQEYIINIPTTMVLNKI